MQSVDDKSANEDGRCNVSINRVYTNTDDLIYRPEPAQL